jgi:hypothetical protein
MDDRSPAPLRKREGARKMDEDEAQKKRGAEEVLGAEPMSVFLTEFVSSTFISQTCIK